MLYRSFRLLGLLSLLIALIACTDYDYDVPDTEANRNGFDRHFGFVASADVKDVYYFADEMGADVLYQLGFKAGPETVARIVDELDLTQSNVEDINPGLSYDLSWWDKVDIQQATRYWISNAVQDYVWALWYSETTQCVYYLEYSL
ncbi:MAG: hypothetical protein JXA33_24740 [Anaerolineae bacterium]|nr:hypothetical protein [Anaerolineae bacterium]